MTPKDAKKIVMDRLAPTIVVVRYGKDGFMLATQRLYDMIHVHNGLIFTCQFEAQGYADELNASIQRGELRV